MGRAAAGRQDAPVLRLSAECSVSPVSCEARDCGFFRGVGLTSWLGAAWTEAPFVLPEKCRLGDRGGEGRRKMSQPFPPPG